MKSHTDVLIFHTQICAGASQICLMAEEKLPSQISFRPVANAPEWRIIMDVYVDRSYPEGRTLLERDKLSYAVLDSVLGGDVKKIITDHKRLIIAHTAKVFPTWIWAPDDVTEQELEQIYQTISAEFDPICEYRFNTKYEIADYLINRLKRDNKGDWNITVNIAAYECHEAKAPEKEVDGYLEQMNSSQLELAARMIEEASIAIGDRVFTHEESEQAAKEQLERRVLYIWRNKEGKAVAFCDRNVDNNYVKVSQCYTLSEERGKGYAAQMIYELCKDIIEDGQVPMLYADADYVSSNRCYQKIGFECRGKIATIGVNME